MRRLNYPTHMSKMFSVIDRKIMLQDYRSKGLTCTALDLHRFLQDLALRTQATVDLQLDITDPNPSIRMADDTVVLVNGFSITPNANARIREGRVFIDEMNKKSFVDLTTGATIWQTV